jgi:hypothetical protein
MVAQFYLHALGVLSAASYNSQGYGEDIVTHLHRGTQGSGSDYFVTDGQSANLSRCLAPVWGPWPDLYYGRTFEVFMLRGALPGERMDPYFIHTVCCHSSPSPVELMTTSYYLIWDSPNLKGQAPAFISPRKSVAIYYLWALGSLFIASYGS